MLVEVIWYGIATLYCNLVWAVIHSCSDIMVDNVAAITTRVATSFTRVRACACLLRRLHERACVRGCFVLRAW